MTTQEDQPLFQVQSDESMVPVVPSSEELSERQKYLLLLEACKGKHFVFLFGSPAAGKTAVVGSLIQAMQRPEVLGKLYVHGAGDGYFASGLQLWSQIRHAFDNRRFPSRTKAGTTIQIHTQYRSPSNTTLDLVFLEMAGEDLKEVQINDSGHRRLPFHIEQFLKIRQLEIAFLIITSWKDAAKDDVAIDDFLTFINQTAPHLTQKRVLLIITKWDTRPQNTGDSASVSKFVKETMPRTFNKISGARNVIQPFSVGEVVPFEGDEGDIIDTFDYGAHQRLFARIYETFTGVSVAPPDPSNKKPSWKFW